MVWVRNDSGGGPRLIANLLKNGTRMGTNGRFFDIDVDTHRVITGCLCYYFTDSDYVGLQLYQSSSSSKNFDTSFMLEYIG